MTASPVEPRRGVGSQAVFLAVATGVAQVLVALIYVFAARGVEPGTFGIVAAGIALGTTAAGFIDFGTNSHWVREVARGQIDRHDLGARLVGKLAIAIVICALWVVVATLVWRDSALWMAGPIMLGIVVSQTLQVPLRGAARGELVAAVLIVDRVVATVVFFSLLIGGVAAISILWIALFAGSLAGSLFAWILTARHLRPVFSVQLSSNPWRGSGYFGIAGLATSAQTLDLPILTAVAGPFAAGLYGAVGRWTQPMSLLATAFSSASAPFIASSQNIVAAWAHLRKALWMPITAIGISVAVFFLAPVIVPVVLGSAYTGSADVLRVLALVVIPSIISQPAVVALQSLGRDRFVAITMAGAVVMQLALVGILGAVAGAMGAALASLVVQIVMLFAFVFAVVGEFRSVAHSGEAGPARE